MIKRNILDCMTLVGGTPSRYEGEKTYVSTGAVDCDHVDYAQAERVTYDNRPSRANLSVAEGDILFAKMCGTKKTLRIDRPLSEHLFFFQYDSFNNLFIDWMYVFECRESGVVDIRKFHADRVFAKNRPQIVIKPEEQDYVIIQRDGQYYLRLCTDPGKGLSIILKTGYTDLENIESPPKN